MKERSGASPLDPAQRAVLQAAIGSPETPDYALIRAVAALDDGETRRMGRLTAMGRPFVTGARRTIRERGASALLDDPPSPQERLLDVATARIRAGHADFAMREIEREAEIPHRTVYNAYTKTALVQACRRRAQTVWRTRYERRVLLAHQDPARRPVTAIDLILAWVGSAQFAGDQALRIRPDFTRERRDDDLREHIDELVRFGTTIADEAEMLLPEQYGVYLAATVEGAAAWFDRRSAGYAAAIMMVETLLARSRTI
ncbi:MAG TPA: hypothetical protein VFB22_03630 [Candidatus Baltobacteraceae bacterium]|nr:hypothetical protein [Candidatus Baltobacteraceae bacterium]